MRASPGEVTIRPYDPRDRASVRSICFETGYMGDHVGWMWRDEESFSDLFTKWWTDEEPGSALVAEADGEVAGYLLGCVDSSRVALPTRLMARHMFVRRQLLASGTAGVMWRIIGDGVLDALRHRLPVPVHDERWPAHLHIDMLAAIRGRGVGRDLVRRWLDSLRALGVAGCHLETLAENTSAISFFEAMGFEKRGEPANAPGFRSPEGRRHHVQLMVQDLSGPR